MFWSVVQKSINRETLGSRQLSDKNLQDTLNKKKSRYGRLGCFFCSQEKEKISAMFQVCSHIHKETLEALRKL